VGVEFSLLAGPLRVSDETVCGDVICRPIDDRTEVAQLKHLQENLEQALQQRDRFRLLLDLNNRVAAHCGIRQVFHTRSSGLRRLFKCECVGLALPDRSGDQLRQHLIDFPDSKGYFREGTVFPIESSSAGLAYRSGKAVVLDNFSEVRANWNTEAFKVFSAIVDNEGTRSGCFLPLLNDERAFGRAATDQPAGAAFAHQDVDFLDQVADCDYGQKRPGI
jgi:formate hydrogenlyase transcriptional activator